MVALDDLEHLVEIEVGKHVRLQADAKGEGDEYGDAAGVGGWKDPRKGGLQALLF